MRTVPQTQIYAGFVFYTPPQFQGALKAMSNFQAKSEDPKAEIVGSFGIAGGQLIFAVYCVYDAPIAPTGTFDEFLTIPYTVSTLQTQSFSSFIQSTAIPATPR